MHPCRSAVCAAAPKSNTEPAPRGAPAACRLSRKQRRIVRNRPVEPLHPDPALARPIRLSGRDLDELLQGPTGLKRRVRDGLRPPKSASLADVPDPHRIASGRSEPHKCSAMLQMDQFVAGQPTGAGHIVPTFMPLIRSEHCLAGVLQLFCAQTRTKSSKERLLAFTPLNLRVCPLMTTSA